jgi:hypothetical protein
VGVAAILPDGLDERKVLVGLVATAPHRPLHEHNHTLEHCRLDVVDMSPLHSRSKVRTYPQLAQVRGLHRVPRAKVAPKSGRVRESLPAPARPAAIAPPSGACSATRPTPVGLVSRRRPAQRIVRPSTAPPDCRAAARPARSASGIGPSRSGSRSRYRPS